MRTSACQTPRQSFDQTPIVDWARIRFRFWITDLNHLLFHPFPDIPNAAPSGVQGCFLSSCVTTSAGDVDGIDVLLRQAITATDARLAQRFEVEKASGVLSADFPSLERARLMFDLRQGHVFRARTGFSANDLKKNLGQGVQSVLA